MELRIYFVFMLFNFNFKIWFYIEGIILSVVFLRRGCLFFYILYILGLRFGINIFLDF